MKFSRIGDLNDLFERMVTWGKNNPLKHTKKQGPTKF